MTFIFLLIYAITLPLAKMPDLPPILQRLQLSELVFLFLAISWFKDLIKKKRLPQDTGLNKIFSVFVAFAFLSFLRSLDLLASTIEFLALVYLFVIFNLTFDIVDTKRKLDMVVKAWVGTTAVVLALGFIGLGVCVMTGKGNPFCIVLEGIFPYLKTVYRVQSTTRYPSGLANYLIAGLGFIFSDYLLTENKRYKIFLKMLLFLISLMIVATISREVLSLILFFVLVYGYLHLPKNLKFRITRFLLISLFIAAFLFITIFSSTIYIRSYKLENIAKEMHRELAVNIDYAYNLRFARKVAALEMIRRHPFLGVGLRMYRTYTQRLNDEDYFKGLLPIYEYTIGGQYLNYVPPSDPHNEILQYVAETGIFGGGAFALFIAMILYLIFTNLKSCGDDQYLKVRLFSFFASFIGILLVSMDGGGIKARHTWFLMALILALIRACRGKVRK